MIRTKFCPISSCDHKWSTEIATEDHCCPFPIKLCFVIYPVHLLQMGITAFDWVAYIDRWRAFLAIDNMMSLKVIGGICMCVTIPVESYGDLVNMPLWCNITMAIQFHCRPNETLLTTSKGKETAINQILLPFGGETPLPLVNWLYSNVECGNWASWLKTLPKFPEAKFHEFMKQFWQGASYLAISSPLGFDIGEKTWDQVLVRMNW